MPFPVNTNSGQKTLNKLPDECPYCHRSILPNVIHGYIVNRNMEVFMNCPNENCSKSFIGYYNFSSGNNWNFNYGTSQGNLIGKSFKEVIVEISPMFEIIYNQAFSAEQQNLKEISGVGYRKALEFLIKDYLIARDEKTKDKILKMRLGNCIKDLVEDTRIKTVAKRAVWLGNDETHYLRKWEGKDLSDLKKLIDLTVHWIEMEKLTESFEDEMPD